MFVRKKMFKATIKTLSEKLGYDDVIFYEGINEVLLTDMKYDSLPVTKEDLKEYRDYVEKRLDRYVDYTNDLNKEFMMLIRHLNLEIENGKRIIKKKK